MRILQATEQDLDAIVEINHQLNLNIKGCVWDNPKWIRECVDDGDYFVVRQNGSVYGALCLWHLPHESYIAALAVSEGQQGNGYGRRLVEFAKKKSRNAGNRVLTVESFCEYDAVPFYERCGFKLEQKIRKYHGHRYYSFSMRV